MQGHRPLRTDAAHRNTCLCVGSVYGLVSGTVLPGRLPTPKRSGIVTRLLLTYRCGGSAGLAFVGFTGFPFHLCDREVYKHLNAALVCRPSSAASTGSQSTTEWISWAAIARCRCACNSTRSLRLGSGERDSRLGRLAFPDVSYALKRLRVGLAQARATDTRCARARGKRAQMSPHVPQKVWSTRSDGWGGCSYSATSGWSS